jgi:hypothetical protein
MMAAAVTAALATCALFLAAAVFAQPASDSLGELLVGKAAFGDWRTDAPLVRRKITDLPPPYATRDFFTAAGKSSASMFCHFNSSRAMPCSSSAGGKHTLRASVYWPQ